MRVIKLYEEFWKKDFWKVKPEKPEPTIPLKDDLRYKEEIIEKIKDIKKGGSRDLGSCQIIFDDNMNGLSMTVEYIGSSGDDIRWVNSHLEYLGLPSIKELKNIFKFSQMGNPERVYNIIFQIK